MTRLVKWIRKNQKGTTMVEMIVTFGLLSIFLTASVMLVANYANIQAKISGQISAENVSEMVFPPRFLQKHFTPCKRRSMILNLREVCVILQLKGQPLSFQTPMEGLLCRN